MSQCLGRRGGRGRRVGRGCVIVKWLMEGEAAEGDGLAGVV